MWFGQQWFGNANWNKVLSYLTSINSRITVNTPVIVTSPVSNGQMELIMGDSYTSLRSRSIEFPLVGIDPVNAKFHLYIDGEDVAQLDITSNKSVWDVTATQTLAWGDGQHYLTGKVIYTNGDVITKYHLPLTIRNI